MTSGCHAPWVNLHLDPQGWLTACAANKRQPIGHVHDGPILEAWRGAAATHLRSQFEGEGIGAGCEMCRWQRDTNGPSAMYARIYDHLPVEANPAWPQHAEFTLSSDCNLRCTMCNGAFSSSIRLHREGLAPRPSPYDERFFAQLPPILDHLVTAKFLGGEPFLSSENLRVWELIAESTRRPSCHVTTNGTVLTPRVASLLEALPMSFAVSIDGATAETVERIRVGARFADLLANVERLLDHADRNGTTVSFTYCLMTENWHELGAFLELADRFDVGVYVNTVTSPVRHSLYHLPAARLAEVVAALDATDADQRERLGRNRDVWVDQLDRLRSAAQVPINDGEVPVHLPGFRHPPSVPSIDVPDAGRAEAALGTWSRGSTVAALEVGSDGTIESVEGGLPGIHVDRLVALGIDELFLWLQSAFGRLTESSYLRHAPDAGDRAFTFEDPGRTTEVRMISGRLPDGRGWWRLATRATSTEAAQHAPPLGLDR